MWGAMAAGGGAQRATVEDSPASASLRSAGLGRSCPANAWAACAGLEVRGGVGRTRIVGYEANLTEPDDPWLHLRDHVNGERVECMVRLVTTRPNYGGHRGGPLPAVGRRAAKLYLLPAPGCSGAARPTG